MGLVTAFEYDIFISYAHIDDAPLMTGEEGWVAKFHQSLEVLIRQILGDAPKIWRDPKLGGNDYFGDELVGALPKTAVLVSIISPRYLKSEWCLRELDTFLRGAEARGGVRVGNKSRIFKVLKTLVPHEVQPPSLTSLLGYEFYRVDAATGKPSEFRIEFGPEARQSYLAKLYDLAYEIAEFLKSLGPGAAGQAQASSKPPVFLAQTSVDMRDERDRIRAELRQLGHTVLPDRELPLDAPGLEKAVQADLQRSALAVHLVGEHYGFVPDLDERSVVHLQNDIAAAYSREHGLPRLIWMPPGLALKDKRQQSFVERIENDADAQHGADLLRTSLEELKLIIQEKLTVKQPAKAHKDAASDLTLVYLVCDKCDSEASAPLSEYLYDQGFEVMLPVFDGEVAAVREDHTEKLLSSDAIIVYYGTATDLWLSSKLRDLRKLPGYGEAKPKLATAIYAGLARTEQKERLKSREFTVIKDFAPSNPVTALQPLLAAISAARSAVA